MSKSAHATSYLHKPFYRSWTLTANKRIVGLGRCANISYEQTPAIDSRARITAKFRSNGFQ